MPRVRSSRELADLERALRDKDELLMRERRAREELERANRAKDRFIAMLSHDLRAPLNAILGWTQLLRREVLDQTARNRAFETIERNARTQAKLIEELLDISRMVGGQGSARADADRHRRARSAGRRERAPEGARGRSRARVHRRSGADRHLRSSASRAGALEPPRQRHEVHPSARADRGRGQARRAPP